MSEGKNEKSSGGSKPILSDQVSVSQLKNQKNITLNIYIDLEKYKKDQEIKTTQAKQLEKLDSSFESPTRQDNLDPHDEQMSTIGNPTLPKTPAAKAPYSNPIANRRFSIMGLSTAKQATRKLQGFTQNCSGSGGSRDIYTKSVSKKEKEKSQLMAATSQEEDEEIEQLIEKYQQKIRILKEYQNSRSRISSLGQSRILDNTLIDQQPMPVQIGGPYQFKSSNSDQISDVGHKMGIKRDISPIYSNPNEIYYSKKQGPKQRASSRSVFRDKNGELIPSSSFSRKSSNNHYYQTHKTPYTKSPQGNVSKQQQEFFNQSIEMSAKDVAHNIEPLTLHNLIDYKIISKLPWNSYEQLQQSDNSKPKFEYWLSQRKKDSVKFIIKYVPKIKVYSNLGRHQCITATLQERKFHITTSKIENIQKLIDYIDLEHEDILVYYHNGFNQTLFQQLYITELTFENSSKLCQINHTASLFYKTMKSRPAILNVLVYKMAKILDSVANSGFCFGNLRAENILIKVNPNATKNIDLISDIKLIDFSQVFSVNNLSNVKFDTNQKQWYYMPPEITEVLLRKKERPDLKTNFPNSLVTPWCFDIYSFGILLLELVIGVPFWIEQRVLILHFNQKYPYKKAQGGLMNHHDGSQCDPTKDNVKKLRKINNVQTLNIRTVPQLLEVMKQNGNYRNLDLVLLLTKMLDINPSKRLSPQQILGQKFVNMATEEE